LEEEDGALTMTTVRVRARSLNTLRHKSTQQSN